MKKRRSYNPFYYVLLMLFFLSICCYGWLSWGKMLLGPQNGTFVTRSGSSLRLGGNMFRFSGANLPWLGLLKTEQGLGYPSPFEIDDAMATAAGMGETVVRGLTLGISVGCSLCIEPALGTFNQQAL